MAPVLFLGVITLGNSVTISASSIDSNVGIVPLRSIVLLSPLCRHIVIVLSLDTVAILSSGAILMENNENNTPSLTLIDAKQCCDRARMMLDRLSHLGAHRFHVDNRQSTVIGAGEE